MLTTVHLTEPEALAFARALQRIRPDSPEMGAAIVSMVYALTNPEHIPGHQAVIVRVGKDPAAQERYEHRRDEYNFERNYCKD